MAAKATLYFTIARQYLGEFAIFGVTKEKKEYARDRLWGRWYPSEHAGHITAGQERYGKFDTLDEAVPVLNGLAKDVLVPHTKRVDEAIRAHRAAIAQRDVDVQAYLEKAATEYKGLPKAPPLTEREKSVLDIAITALDSMLKGVMLHQFFAATHEAITESITGSDIATDPRNALLEAANVVKLGYHALDPAAKATIRDTLTKLRAIEGQN